MFKISYPLSLNEKQTTATTKTIQDRLFTFFVFFEGHM